jgi:hypothetical protein
MKKITLSFIFNLFLTVFSSAQWVHSGPDYSTTNTENFIEHNGILWSLQTYMLYNSVNNGNTWNVVCDIPTSFFGLEFFNNSKIIAPTNEGILISIDSGNNWNYSNSGLSGSYLIQSRIYKTSTNRLILGNGAYFSDDEGATWNAPQNLIGTIRGLEEINNKLIAVKLLGPSVYVSSDNGINWVESISGISTSNANNGFSRIIQKNGILYIGNSSATGVYKSTDLGQTWTQITTGLSGTANAGNPIRLLNNQIIRQANNGCFTLNETTDIWTLNTLYQTSNVAITNYHNGKYWGTGIDYDGLVNTSNNGLTWENSYTGLKQGSFSSLSVTKNTLFANSRGSFMYDTISGIWTRFVPKGFDFGGSITNYALGTVFDMQKGSNNKFYAATEGGVWSSADNGATWTQHTTGLSVANGTTLPCVVNNLYVFGTGGNDTIVAATAAGIYYSTNQAQSFTQATGANTGNFNLLKFIQGKLYAGGNGMYFSTDRGISWSVFNNITSGSITSMAATTNKMFVVSNQSSFVTNLNGGSGLQSLLIQGNPLGCASIAALDSLAFFNFNGIFKINEDELSSGSVAGDVMTNVSLNLPFRPQYLSNGDTSNTYTDYMLSSDMEIFNGKLWLGTARLSTFYRPMNDFGYSFTVANKEQELPRVSNGIAFPNPSSNAISISNLKNNCSIRVFNQLGQLQLLLQNVNSSVIDISQLSSGIYSYSITNHEQDLVGNGKFVRE